MENRLFFVGLLSFAIGVLFMYFATIQDIKVTRVISNGEEIKSALVTIDIRGEKFQYYKGE